MLQIGYMNFFDIRLGTEAGNIGHKEGDILLQGVNHLSNIVLLAEGASHAQSGVHFINNAVGLDTDRVLVHPLTGIETSLSFVAGFCINTHLSTLQSFNYFL